MKTRLNIILFLFACSFLGCAWYVLTTFSDSHEQSLGGSSFTNVTFSGGGGNDNWTLPTLRQSMPSLRMSHAPVSSYAPVYSSPMTNPIGGTPSYSASGTSTLYATSDATMKSFGGGGNVVSVSGGQVSNAPSVSAGAYAPIAYSQSPIVYRPSSSVSLSVMDAVEAVANPGNQMSATASTPYTSPFSADYALNSSYNSAFYGSAFGGGTIGSRRVGGRQNAGPSSGLGNSWLNWLYENYDVSTTFNDQTAYEAWEAMYAAWESGVMSGPCPTYEEFLAWLMAGGEDGYTKDDRTYKYLPVGGILPLFLMALIYAIILFVKRNKTAQL